MEDVGAYEFNLNSGFNVRELIETSAGGSNGLWLTYSIEGEMYRFRGVLLPSYDRVMIDVGSDFVYVNSPAGQSRSKREIASEVMRKVGGHNLSKDGVVVE